MHIISRAKVLRGIILAWYNKTQRNMSKLTSQEPAMTTPIDKSVKALAHTPQYRMHKYFARRPYNVFRHLIEHYSKPGDVILDCFCGGGVTVCEAAHLQRKPIGVDLNSLATFITKMEMFDGDVAALKKYLENFLTKIEKQYADWYKVEFADDAGIMEWCEWCYVVTCPECGAEILLSEKNKVANGKYYCPNPNCQCHTSGAKRTSCMAKDIRPLRVKYLSDRDGTVRVRSVARHNFPIFQQQLEDYLADLAAVPNFVFPDDWDRQHEDKLKEKGILEYRDLFTERNFVLNCLIFDAIQKYPDQKDGRISYNEYLYFLFSATLRYTNNMTRVLENWEGGNPTSMDKHAFYLPNQFVENNIISIFKKRLAALIKGCDFARAMFPERLQEAKTFTELTNTDNTFMLLNQSSASLPIPDQAVDVVITDPPYGSNVQYAELSTVWNAWYAAYAGLESYIFKCDEAVVNRKKCFQGHKTEDDYEKIMQKVFTECARVLKDHGYLVFTFNNKNLKVWVAMLKAVALSGFALPDNGIIFQDYVSAYKQTAHLRFSGNVQGDLIYSFRKEPPEIKVDYTGKDIFGIIKTNLTNKINELFTNKHEYSTPDLYREVMISMTKDLMNYICWCNQTNQEIPRIDELSKDYIDISLREVLSYDNGVWKKP